jgi:hypothetical protein
MHYKDAMNKFNENSNILIIRKSHERLIDVKFEYKF